jgi:arylsulfatase A-like enzyme
MSIKFYTIVCNITENAFIKVNTLKVGFMKKVLLLLFVFLNFPNRAQRPNVIYVLTDQWRSDAFGYAGNKVVKTPNIDSFSSEAIIFRNAVSVCPVCTPYRASLMTGKYPTSTGMFLNDLYLPEKELCMAEIYKSAGYQTAYYGKWHLDGHGRINNVQPYRRQGFDYWKALECSHDYNNMPYYENNDPEIKYWKKYSPFAIAEDAGDYLEELSKNNDPFLLFISFESPHFPHLTAPEEYKMLYPPSELTFDKNVTEDKFPGIRKELQGYYAHCTATDKAFGLLIEKIKKYGLYDNSIIIFTSDHGEMMGSHGIRPTEKQMAWNESVRIPFLIRYPGIHANKGSDIFTPLNTPDILPTMLSLSGIKIPHCIEGEDLSPLIRNPGKQKDRAALFMSVSPFARTPFTEYRGIRTIQYTYVETPGEATMLFDNTADPGQMNNLAGNPESKKLQDKMSGLLQKKLKEIGDADFKTRQFYIEKWGFQPGEGGAIPYSIVAGKEYIVQTPKKSAMDTVK